MNYRQRAPSARRIRTRRDPTIAQTAPRHRNAQAVLARKTQRHEPATHARPGSVTRTLAPPRTPTPQRADAPLFHRTPRPRNAHTHPSPVTRAPTPPHAPAPQRAHVPARHTPWLRHAHPGSTAHAPRLHNARILPPPRARAPAPPHASAPSHTHTPAPPHAQPPHMHASQHAPQQSPPAFSRTYESHKQKGRLPSRESGPISQGCRKQERLVLLLLGVLVPAVDQLVQQLVKRGHILVDDGAGGVLLGLRRRAEHLLIGIEVM